MAKSKQWHLDRLSALLIPDEPEAKRAYTRRTPLSVISAKRFERSIGYDTDKAKLNQPRPVGRPKGSKNKSKPEGYIGQGGSRRGARPVEPFDRDTSRKHFAMHNGRVWRLVGGKLSHQAARMQHGYTAKHKRIEYESIHFKGQWQLATTVAWWLQTDDGIPVETHVVRCHDLQNYPNLSLSNLYLDPI